MINHIMSGYRAIASEKLFVLILVPLLLLSFALSGCRTGIDKSTDDPVLAFAVYDGEDYVEIPLQFAASYYKNSGIHADGIRMFASVGQTIRMNELPEIIYTDTYDVKYNEPSGWETTVELTVYRDTGKEEPERLPSGTILSSLEPGRYVLDYCYKITRKEDYDIRSAVFWLIVE